MSDKTDKKIYATWDKRWRGSKENAEVTFLGRAMFNEKRKVLLDVLKDIDVETVLEAGCGQGHTLKFLQTAGYDSLGIDVSANAIKICKKKGLNVKQKKLEDVTDSYDLVSSDGMLEHFLHFEPYAKEMMRISRKYVLLIQPNYSSRAGQALAFLSNLFRSHVNVYEYNYRISDFVSIFHRNSFKLISSRPVFKDVFRLLLFMRIDKE